MLPSIKNFNFNNKKVLVRCDFSVPISKNKVLDDFRIQRSLETISYLKDNGASIYFRDGRGKLPNAYAARYGHYGSLTTYEVTEEGHLAGTIEIPLALGTIGGATKIHPVARSCLKIMDVNSAIELAEVVASAGLAQNLAALRALSDEGIQKGHMKLHARNFVSSIDGISEEEIEKVLTIMFNEGQINKSNADSILKKIREKKN